MVTGELNLVASLQKKYPDQSERIQLYFDTIRRQQMTCGLYFLSKVVLG